MPAIVPAHPSLDSIDAFQTDEDTLRGILESDEYRQWLEEVDHQAEVDAERAAQKFADEWRQDQYGRVYSDAPW